MKMDGALQKNLKGGSALRKVKDSDAAMMSPDDLADYGQSKPGARGLGGIEWLKISDFCSAGIPLPLSSMDMQMLPPWEKARTLISPLR